MKQFNLSAKWKNSLSSILGKKCLIELLKVSNIRHTVYNIAFPNNKIPNSVITTSWKKTWPEFLTLAPKTPTLKESYEENALSNINLIGFLAI